MATEGRPSYVVDGKPFDRLRGSGLPDEVHQALRLPKVDAENDTDFDVHFGTQKSPIFLLANSPANAARFFASSSDAIRFVAIQKRHKDKYSDTLRKRTELESESKQVNAELAQLEPVVELDRLLKMVEQSFRELDESKVGLKRPRSTKIELAEQAAVTASVASYAVVLNARYAAPPELNATTPLAELILTIETAADNHRRAILRAEALMLLSAPPVMGEVAMLKTILGKSPRTLNAGSVRRSTARSSHAYRPRHNSRT